MVSSYWSNADNAMIIPIDDDYAARLTARITIGQSVTSSDHVPPRSDAEHVRAPRRAASRTVTTRGRCTAAKSGRRCRWWSSATGSRRRRGRSPDSQSPGTSGTLSVPLHGEHYSGLDLVGVDQVVSVDYLATATSLTLTPTGPASEMNFDLDVACSVRDASIVGTLAVDAIATPQITVGFVGSVLELEAQYTEQLESCLKSLTAGFKEDFEPDWTLPDGGGPVEVDPTAAALPLWTRIALYERSLQAARVVRPRRSGAPWRGRGRAPRHGAARPSGARVRPHPVENRRARMIRGRLALGSRAG